MFYNMNFNIENTHESDYYFYSYFFPTLVDCRLFAGQLYHRNKNTFVYKRFVFDYRVHLSRE